MQSPDPEVPAPGGGCLRPGCCTGQGLPQEGGPFRTCQAVEGVRGAFKAPDLCFPSGVALGRGWIEGRVLGSPVLRAREAGRRCPNSIPAPGAQAGLAPARAEPAICTRLPPGGRGRLAPTVPEGAGGGCGPRGPTSGPLQGPVSWKHDRPSPSRLALLPPRALHRLPTEGASADGRDAGPFLACAVRAVWASARPPGARAGLLLHDLDDVLVLHGVGQPHPLGTVLGAGALGTAGADPIGRRAHPARAARAPGEAGGGPSASKPRSLSRTPRRLTTPDPAWVTRRPHAPRTDGHLAPTWKDRHIVAPA